MFKRLRINEWRQYDAVDISFHKRLTIITGANSAGKSTLLNVLNQSLGGFFFPLVSMPLLEQGQLSYFSSVWRPNENLYIFKANANPIINNNQPTFKIGTLEYNDNYESTITVPVNPGSTYGIQFDNPRQVKGIFISSSKPPFKYESIQNIPINYNKSQGYNNYKNAFNSRLNGNSARAEGYLIKESLLAWGTLGKGNDILQSNSQLIDLFDGFEVILKKVLPKSLGFERLMITLPEIVLLTDTGDFPIDAVSGGVAAIIDLAWQIYIYDSNGMPFIVTIDEPETHLHPELQKSLLPNIINAFPLCQFIVATHSPFIISSVQDSNAYALKYNESGRVISLLLDRANKAGSANDILKEVLGLEDTLPNWVDNEIELLIQRYKSLELGDISIEKFKEELNNAGLSKYVPESLLKLLAEYRAEITKK